MNYKDYQNARDAAWKILIDLHICKLPVQIKSVCNQLGIRVKSFRSSASAIQQIGREELLQSTDGFTTYIAGSPVIFYNDALPVERCRFTVAHELGHIILSHVRPGNVTAINREPSPSDSTHEQEANVFASRLLAPACVLWALDVHTPEEIAHLAEISHQAAAFRAQRMSILYQRERMFLRERGRSCFLMSPLERQVYQQFQQYIKHQYN